MAESKRNGVMCIATAVDETYAPYVPLFKYCVKKAYPEYDCVVFGIGDIDDCIHVDPLINNHSRFVAASVRFLIGDGVLDKYQYCLITDSDILIRRETPDIVKQHTVHMFCNNLKYYDNSDHGDHMPGVHFVVQGWWEITRKARAKQLERLKTRENMEAGQDEVMLKDIVMDANLTVNKHMILWNIHGMHLGRFRDCNIGAVRFQPTELGFIDELLNDTEFMGLVDVARSKSDLVNKVWKNVLAIYELRKAG